MFFDPRRYDLAKVGRYKFNKKLALKNRITGKVLAEDVVDPSTGEILAKEGDTVSRELAENIQNAGILSVTLKGKDPETDRKVKVLSNLMVGLSSYVSFDPEEVGVTELVYYPALMTVMAEAGGDEEALKEAIKKNIHELVPKHITK